MAAIDITISGVLYDKTQRTTQPVVLIGEASLTGLGVGGGPIQPPNQPPSGKPDHIWGGGNEPFPTPPIPIYPGGSPNPPDRPKPPEPVQPPVQWKPIWTQEHGWVAVGIIDPNIPHPTPSEAPAPAKK